MCRKKSNDKIFSNNFNVSRIAIIVVGAPVLAEKRRSDYLFKSIKS
jgi:hypothetical protein